MSEKPNTGKKWAQRKPNEPPQKAMETVVKHYVENVNVYDKRKKFTSHELEVRFGTKGIRPLTKIDYDNVISKLRSLGFTCANEQGQYYLRMNAEILDPVTGIFKESNIRAEVAGFQAIQDYCKNDNNLEEIHNNTTKYSYPPVHFLKKTLAYVNDEPVRPVDFDDFNFRVSYQIEKTMDIRQEDIANMLKGWQRLKKTHRFINRVTFEHPDFPIKVDISIVKKSKVSEDRRFIPVYTTDESEVFQNPEVYEIELEIDNKKIGYSDFKTTEQLLTAMRKVIKYVLMGLQGTNYPCSYLEQNAVLQEYSQLIRDSEEKRRDSEKSRGEKERRFYPVFIGPSSYTLQLENIVPDNDNARSPNICKNYTVTDKADGERHMMFISSVGKIYLINGNLKIVFTGSKTDNKEVFNTLIDGEIIKHDKSGKFINLYAAFDIYFVNKTDVRSFGFVPVKEEDAASKFRLPVLKNIIKVINPKSVVPEETLSPIRIESKRFYPTNPSVDNIFKACSYILGKEQEGLFEYNTDGLIFTPANMGVGTDKIGKPSPNTRVTWDYSFKWKPAEFNTIDFLVTTQKGEDGADLVLPIFQDGISTEAVSQVKEYKKIILRCGFNEEDHGYINPCQNILDDELPSSENIDNESKYKPVQFYPTSPYDPAAGICNIMLKKDDTGVNQMFTEENEVFVDNTIVEFRYEMSNEKQWRWVPLRVRYDKTTELKQGKKNFGNAYHVANSNWHSIHFPVTLDMITTGTNIPVNLDESVADEDVYYNKANTRGERKTSKTRALRDFHNLYVKSLLITKVSKKGNTLIDYACGKAGDLPKWIEANLSFVFGIDVARDNLENRVNGACARFLTFRKKFKSMPYALFVNGNSSANIRSGQAMLNDKAVHITKAVFGQGPKDEEKIGKGVARQFGKGEDGFNVSSCQFALHYFFENTKTFHNFMRNVSECTKLGGYFIATAYDGKLIYNLLKNKKMGESVQLYEDDIKIWEIQKNYEDNLFIEDDASSLGHTIDVYQESIDKTFPEYLINFDYLERIMENYGFKLITRDEALLMGIPEGTGLFSDLFNQMNDEIKRDKSRKNSYGTSANMNAYEKKISFLNRYVVYKKISNVNAEKISLEMMAEDPGSTLSKVDKTPVTKIKRLPKKLVAEKPAVRKLNKKLVLLAASDEQSEESPVEEPTVEAPTVEEPTVEEAQAEIVPKKIKKPRVKKLKLVIDE